MKQKNKDPQKVVRQEETEKKTGKGKLIAFSLLILFFSIGVVVAGSYLRGADTFNFVRNILVSCGVTLGVIYVFISGVLLKRFKYSDNEHPGRFAFNYCFGLLMSFVFILLPETGWMLLFFFVALSIVSDAVCGMLGGSALLTITALIAGDPTGTTFIVYLLGGCIGIALFSRVGEDFKITVPLILSLGTQLLLIFAGELLVRNSRLGWEDTLIPIVNIMVCGVMLLIFLQQYANKVARKEHDTYHMLNDPEYEIMRSMRDESEEIYFRALHTAYLTERICSRLKMDVVPAKCAAYYYRLPKEQREKMPIPKKAKTLIEQLQGGKNTAVAKEAVIVLICDTVITTIMYLSKQAGGAGLLYDPIIDKLFEKKLSPETFLHSEISLGELQFARKRLKEEKMFYSFMKY